MYGVDPEFKMSYDLRNDQEVNARLQRQTRNTRETFKRSSMQEKNACPIFSSQGLRWTTLVALALVGAGVGFQLGRDQYKIKSK